MVVIVEGGRDEGRKVMRSKENGDGFRLKEEGDRIKKSKFFSERRNKEGSPIEMKIAENFPLHLANTSP